MNSWLLVTLDSCRYDALARSPHARSLATRLGTHLEERWAYATWTGPAHVSLLSGLLPHRGIPKDSRRTPDLYRDDLLGMVRRLDVPRSSLKTFAPGLWLPSWFGSIGYATIGVVSLPVLNEGTICRTGFGTYRRIGMGDMVMGQAAPMGLPAQLEFASRVAKKSEDRPSFVLVNAGETHYPYITTGNRDEVCEPHMAGLHGVAKALAAGEGSPADADPLLFDAATLMRLRRRQEQAADYCARILLGFVDELRPGTRVTVTADHGEAFGEGGWFGHGPVLSPEVLRVPYIDGFVPG